MQELHAACNLGLELEEVSESLKAEESVLSLFILLLLKR